MSLKTQIQLLMAYFRLPRLAGGFLKGNFGNRQNGNFWVLDVQQTVSLSSY